MAMADLDGTITEHICEYLLMPKPTWGKQLSQKPQERRRKYIDGIIMARRENDYTFLVDIMFS